MKKLKNLLLALLLVIIPSLFVLTACGENKSNDHTPKAGDIYYYAVETQWESPKAKADYAQQNGMTPETLDTFLTAIFAMTKSEFQFEENNKVKAVVSMDFMGTQFYEELEGTYAVEGNKLKITMVSEAEEGEEPKEETQEFTISGTKFTADMTEDMKKEDEDLKDVPCKFIAVYTLTDHSTITPVEQVEYALADKDFLAVAEIEWADDESKATYLASLVEAIDEISTVEEAEAMLQAMVVGMQGVYSFADKGIVVFVIMEEETPAGFSMGSYSEEEDKVVVRLQFIAEDESAIEDVKTFTFVEDTLVCTITEDILGIAEEGACPYTITITLTETVLETEE